MIIKAVPPGGDRALHFVRLKPAISPNVGASGAQFLVGGDCVRASPKINHSKIDISCEGGWGWYTLQKGKDTIGDGQCVIFIFEYAGDWIGNASRAQ